MANTVIELRAYALTGITRRYAPKKNAFLEQPSNNSLPPVSNVWRENADSMIEITSFAGINRPVRRLRLARLRDCAAPYRNRLNSAHVRTSSGRDAPPWHHAECSAVVESLPRQQVLRGDVPAPGL